MIRIGEIEIESLGQRLRRLRRRAGLTQDELAMKSGVSKPRVSQIENDLHGRPMLMTLDCIEKAMTLPHGTLMRIAKLERTPADVVALIPAETLKRFLEVA